MSLTHKSSHANKMSPNGLKKGLSQESEFELTDKTSRAHLGQVTIVVKAYVRLGVVVHI